MVFNFKEAKKHNFKYIQNLVAAKQSKNNIDIRQNNVFKTK